MRFPRWLVIVSPLLAFLSQRALLAADAYVVFGNQVVAIDTEQQKITQRVDLSQTLKSAISAAFGDEGKALILCGASRDSRNSILLRLSVPALHAETSVRLPKEPCELFTRQPSGPAAVSSGEVALLSYVTNRDDTISPRSLDFLSAHTLQPLRRLEIQPDRRICPHEQISFWSLTASKTQLLLVTESGSHWQCRLHFFSYPRLTPTRVLDLLDVCGDVPVALLVP